ncbi:MAG TPA: translocation/assembly module TamB domain-containing protein, partial [Abditibacteriaceae bacterium]
AVGGRGSNEFAGALLQDTQLTNPPVQETQGALLTPPTKDEPDPLDDRSVLQPGGDGPVRVSGNITLSQASLSGTPAGGVSAGGDLPPGPVMDLSLVIGRGVQFSVPNVRALIAGTIDVTGTPADPLVSGVVSIPSGSIRFPTSQARILKGEMRITAYRDRGTNLLRTLVDITATARGQVGKYTITLDVNGPLDFGSESTQNLNIDVTSNPPLSTDQAFSLLLGTRGGNLGQEDYKDAILGVVSSPLLSGIEQSLQRILGLDTLALEYRFNEPITVQVGKSFGDRIYASYRRVLGERFAGLGETYTLRVEYRLKGDVQLGLELSDKFRSADNATTEAGRKSGVRLSIEKTWRF